MMVMYEDEKVQISREAHRASNKINTAAISSGVKWPERDADLFPPFTAVVLNL
jgi:hypothetical protein